MYYRRRPVHEPPRSAAKQAKVEIAGKGFERLALGLAEAHQFGP